ncbi:fas-binding factor 1 homolog isoform X3 [Brienomyrus brachyistius]|uniref:fas-binding factor 1 homolog isoform X3 n=1 Tax=Brienomyrus brachyistius TaxID=42636 RepID=UPI0020B20218|nr:fas-binding factor 1 homolog isoform X3 [Brienomyrus brachyistius]
MSLKQKKGLKGSIDDVLGDLLGDDGSPVRTQPAVRVSGRSGVLTSRSGKRSLLDDDFFSKLAEEVGEDEASDVSEADPAALLENIKDMDEMDADLFAPKKKPSSAPLPATTKASGAGGAKQDPAHLVEGGALEPRHVIDSPNGDAKKPSSAPAAATHSYKRFTFADEEDKKDTDDPLADLLDDRKETKMAVSDAVSEQRGLPVSESPVIKAREMASPSRAPGKRNELTFDEDEDDLMDALGFGESPKGKGGILPHKRPSEPPQLVTTRLDEILGRGTSPRLLERPPTGEKKEVLMEKPAIAKDSAFGDGDFTFGSYQPTVVSTPESRQSQRQSVRFSAEETGSRSPEGKPKSPIAGSPSAKRHSKPAASRPTLQHDSQMLEEKPRLAPPLHSRPSNPAADWLGLSRDPEEQEEDPEVNGGQGAPPPMGASQGSERPSSDGKPPLPNAPASEEAKDWLAGALTRKKNLAAAKAAVPRDPQGGGDEVDLDSFLTSKLRSPPTPRRKGEDAVPTKESSSSLPWETSSMQDTPSRHSSPVKEGLPKPVPPEIMGGNSAPIQLLQSPLPGTGGAVQRKGPEQQAGELSLQTSMIQLEGQVRSLQLERDQLKMLLDSVQQRHGQDTELMEAAHKSRVKMLEESAAEREVRMRQESEGLAERLASVTRLAEQERAELQAQYQRRLAQNQQERDREVERLRELQRRSILEMKKDHEEQVQRLKQLKEEEIDAVTSATSQTRSLTVVIDQMEQFSRRLGELSSRVESTHEHTAQGLEQGARHRDQQLRVLQERLDQQQSHMVEERARLKEVIDRMGMQLAEQQRQLEKERWRVSGEQAKAESAQRGLEEERRALMQRLSVEREELEKAKSALLEEQQAVMQRCADERRRLAAEWAQLHAQEKLQQERAEREASRALERDAHREGTIISMAQEHADLKLRAGELRLHEEMAAKEKAELERQRAELDREKEKLSTAALHLKTRAQEVEAFSKLASDRYEEGERALQEARRVEEEHHTRLSSIRTQVERLRSQEQLLNQERKHIAEQRQEVEHLRRGLPISPQLPAAPILTDVAPALGLPPSTLPPQSTALLSPTAAPELHLKLALLRHTAEKDRDFLLDEQIFLETLKKAPHHPAFHTAC